MSSSGMLRSGALVISDESEERSACIIRVTRIGEQGTLAVTSTILYKILLLRSVRRLLFTANDVPISQIPVIVVMEALRSSEMSVLKRDHMS
jgi:cobalamin synthase